ncbi:MAG TPA: hypothetical protein VMU95_40145 [Trebonia sp.]|nr:hypothetical protein [Trebonia sp.]
MFKQLRDAKDMINAAPGMVAQAQQMAAQAQQMAAAQQAAMQAQMAQAGSAQAGTDPTGPDFEPIAGVGLEAFAAVSKGVAAYGYDQSKLVQIAASRGIPAPAWEAAHQGWNDRIRSNPAVAQRFNHLYRES